MEASCPFAFLSILNSSVVRLKFAEKQQQILRLITPATRTCRRGSRLTTPELKEIRSPFRSERQPVSCCIFQTQDNRVQLPKDNSRI